MNPPDDMFSNWSFGQKMRWGLDRGAFQSRLGQRLVRLWGLGISDPVVKELSEAELRPLMKKASAGQLPPFKVPRFTAGDLTLGLDMNNHPIRIPRSWLRSGVMLISNTGGGKTNLLQFLAIQLGVTGCPVWLSDIYKTQLRHARALFQRAGHELAIVGARDWKWNILQCHFGNPHIQMTFAVDLLTRVLDLPPRSRILLGHGIHALYERFGIWSGSTRSWPCLFDLFEWLRATPDLNPQAREASLDRLGSLLLALTPRCAAYRLAWDPVDLATKSIVFELRGASETAKQILVNSLLFAVFQREVENGAVNSMLRLALGCDDSQRFFNVGGQPASGDLAPMDELAGVIRGTGISLWVLAQTAVGLSRRLVPNLGIKILGRLGCHEDYASLGPDLGLSSEQIEYARLSLEPGSFLCQVSQEWREPFVFTVPHLQIDTVIDDNQAAESRHELDLLPTVFASEYADWQPIPSSQVRESAAPPAPPPPPSQQQRPVLDEAAIRLLKAIIRNPGIPSSAYARLAGLGAQQAIKIREQLVENGFLREHRVSTGARGRQALVLEPTQAAVEALSAAGGAS